ncbi:AMP-binding protein [Acidimicrobiia bacterium EGI L10123]|uniref:AMP-binding protein n=1 Tax=Salinilacustrithrix flava TaxID=2957203 RepID=UPI003D7C2E29|nr:AMP-binding protein [Acidimicrobiia bacterium EGI L10123]
MRVPLTVRDHIDRAELVYGDRIAFVDEPDQPAQSWGSVTYREMAARARSMAVAFDQMGVKHGERVAIVSHNSARLLTAFFGVSAYGRVLVPINFRLNREEIAYIVEHSGASVLLIDPALADDLAGVEAEHTMVLGADTDQQLFRAVGEPIPWEPDEDATATINYTSGTTARPKGVQLTHRSLWLNAATFGWHMGVSDRDVYLHTLPMFHCNGWGMVYAVTGMGGRHIVLRQIDGAEILRRIDDHGVTLLCGAPAVGSIVLDAASSLGDDVPGRGTTRWVMAGAPPPTATIEAVERDLGWEFVQIYGLTETSPLLTINRGRAEYDDLDPTERAQKLSRAGAPAIGVQLSTSESGEVLARSNVVLEGYWEQPDASAAALEGGWFHTGDGGFLDEDHYLHISDRKKDVIISGGENVSSIEVEDCLFSHPDVAEVAVIGVPDEKWGEMVKALVVLAPGATADEAALIEHCRSKLAHYKCPKSIDFRDELARTATGKLQKFKLRAPYWEGQERQVN